MVGSEPLLQLIKMIGSGILPYGLARSSSGEEASDGSATSSGKSVLTAGTVLFAAPAVWIYLTVHEHRAPQPRPAPGKETGQSWGDRAPQNRPNPVDVKAGRHVKVGKEGELGVTSDGSEGTRPPPPTPTATFLALRQAPRRCRGDS